MKKEHLIIFLFIIQISCIKESFISSVYEIANVDSGSAYEVVVNGDYAYVANNSGVSVIDISNPGKLQKITSLTTDEAAFGIYISENILFVGADGNKNLFAFDINMVENPVLKSSLTLQGPVNGISLNNSVLYVSTLNGFFSVIDVSDIVSMKIISTLDCKGQGNDLTFFQDYIYYANSNKGLQIIDVKEPENPEIVRTVNNTSGAWDIAIHDNYLFLSKHKYGFNILSLENPSSPEIIASANSPGEDYGITVNSEYLFVADLQYGVEVWDYSDISCPSLIETIGEYEPHDIATQENFIFLADQQRHFVILKYQNIN